MNIKIKKLNQNAVIPTYAKQGDAGLDLTAIYKITDNKQNIVYGTGLAIEIPQGYVGLVFPRSSNSKTDLRLTNSVGVIDSGYRGEIIFKFRPTANKFKIQTKLDEYEIGDRIGQLIILPYPKVNFIEVDELSQTERGANGYGSEWEIKKWLDYESILNYN